MRLRWIIVAPATALVMIILIVQIQFRLDEQRTRTFDQDLLYLPNEHLLTHFTAGMGPVIADMLWLRALSYTVEEFQGDGRFTWLAQMGDVMTRLDPYFLGAYRYTGLFLAALKADDDASIDILKRGIEHNPTAWQLPYEIAMVYMTNRRDMPQSHELAALWLQASDATGTAPARVRATAQGLMQQHNMADLERAMWEGILLSSTDTFERAIAERKLHELVIRENVEQLNEAAALHVERTGEPPSGFDDLVAAGIFREPPSVQDPLGGEYFFDADGVAQNTTLLTLAVDAIISRVQGRIRHFERAEGRTPQSLDELVLHGYLRRIPDHPYPERSWLYDPATGVVK